MLSKLALIKVALFMIALIISVGVLEFGLRTAGELYLINRGRPETKLPVLSVRSNKKTVSILAMGDSFTFGGGVNSHDAYPALLGELLTKEYPDTQFNVVNNGICEGTTEDVLNLIEKAIVLNSPDILILLAGAANRFTVIGDMDRHSKFRPFLKAVTGLRVFKVGRWTYFNLKDRLFGLHQADFPRLGAPVSPQAGKFRGALEETLGMPSHESIDEKVYEMLYAFERQSEFTAEEAAQIFFARARREADPLRAAELEHVAEAFADRRGWEERVERLMEADLLRIIEIAEQNRVKVVLQNYPVRYKMANDVLARIARKKNLSFVDNEEAFKSILGGGFAERAEFLQDDDHATRRGHLLMAQNIMKTLQGGLFLALDELKANNGD